jgi:glycosyltransferase involved in cell wall biosynthesis
MSQVTFLVPFAYGMGGIPRTTFLVAGELATRGHDVEIFTLIRGQDETFFPLHPDVRLTEIFDVRDPDRPGEIRPRPKNRGDVDPKLRELDRSPTTLSEDPHQFFSALVDQRLEERLSRQRSGIVIATRPELAVAAVRYTRGRVGTILQEHNALADRRQGLRDAVVGITRPGLRRRLDAFLTLTQDELEKWRELLEPTTTRLGVIPNATPFALGPAAPLDRPLVIAAGRYEKQKGFERLIEAWAPIAARHPEWRLEIYGEGRQQQPLQEQIDRLGIGDAVRLAGLTHDMEKVMAGASIYAMSSRHEGLPMVLLEAMSKGVPPVSFNCPEGPRQLIDDGTSGLLVENGNIPALTSALLSVIEDEQLRRRLGAGALERAGEYQIGHVTDVWEELFEQIAARRRRWWQRR